MGVKGVRSRNSHCDDLDALLREVGLKAAA
jgi:hypothetical protein